MLHQDVLMADIDVDQWRNAQALLLRSAKGCRRVVVIHENGRVLKCRHTAGLPVAGAVSDVADPHAVAEALYAANSANVDFVVVMERDAVDSYFAQIQDAWNSDDDLDVFVRNTFAALDEYADGIVTFPGAARDNLGLQWRVGASFEDVDAAAHAFIEPNTTAVLGVESDGRLWTSLILDFDADWKVTSITTADPSLVSIAGTREQLAEGLAGWVEAAGKKVSLAVVLDLAGAREFLAAQEGKAAVLAGLATSGRLAIARSVAELV